MPTTIADLPLELRQQIFSHAIPHPLAHTACNKTWHAIPINLPIPRTPSTCPSHSCLPSAAATRLFIAAVERLLLVSRYFAHDLPGVIDQQLRELLEYKATIPETQMHVATLYPFREHRFKLAGRRDAVRIWDVSVVIRKLIALRQRVVGIAALLSEKDLGGWRDWVSGCDEPVIDLPVLPQVRA